jgi:hypothetical protein
MAHLDALELVDKAACAPYWGGVERTTNHQPPGPSSSLATLIRYVNRFSGF